MIGCLRTRVRKQPIIALYFESENELKLYNLEARDDIFLHRRSCMSAHVLLNLLNEFGQASHFISFSQRVQ